MFELYFDNIIIPVSRIYEYVCRFRSDIDKSGFFNHKKYMSTVQFSQLQRINDLLKEADLLKEQVLKLETDITSLKSHYDGESKRYKEKLQTDHKQRMQLEKIEIEINDLKDTEYQLTAKIFMVIEKALDHYFEKGGYQDFVKSLLQILDKQGLKYSIHANKTNSSFLPKDAKVASDKGFYVETEFTDLALDPTDLKPILREALLKVKVPQALQA